MGASDVKRKHKKHESLRLFCKSAIITAMCILLLCALVGGMLAADKNTKAAAGNLGGLELYNVDDRTLSFELFGTIYSVDLRPIFSAANRMSDYRELVSAERRLEYLAVQRGFNALDRVFYQNMSVDG